MSSFVSSSSSSSSSVMMIPSTTNNDTANHTSSTVDNPTTTSNGFTHSMIPKNDNETRPMTTSAASSTNLNTSQVVVEEDGIAVVLSKDHTTTMDSIDHDNDDMTSSKMTTQSLLSGFGSDDTTTTSPPPASSLPSWRKRGQQLRDSLVAKDSTSMIAISSAVAISQYYAVIDKVYTQFLHHACDTLPEMCQSYLIGIRLSHFMTQLLPQHPDYHSNDVQCQNLYSDNDQYYNFIQAQVKCQEQYTIIQKYLAQIALLIDQSEHEEYIRSIISTSNTTNNSTVNSTNSTTNRQNDTNATKRNRSSSSKSSRGSRGSRTTNSSNGSRSSRSSRNRSSIKSIQINEIILEEDDEDHDDGVTTEHKDTLQEDDEEHMSADYKSTITNSTNDDDQSSLLLLQEMTIVSSQASSASQTSTTNSRKSTPSLISKSVTNGDRSNNYCNNSSSCTAMSGGDSHCTFSNHSNIEVIAADDTTKNDDATQYTNQSNSSPKNNVVIIQSHRQQQCYNITDQKSVVTTTLGTVSSCSSLDDDHNNDDSSCSRNSSNYYSKQQYENHGHVNDISINVSRTNYDDDDNYSTNSNFWIRNCNGSTMDDDSAIVELKNMYNNVTTTSYDSSRGSPKLLNDDRKQKDAVMRSSKQSVDQPKTNTTIHRMLASSPPTTAKPSSIVEYAQRFYELNVAPVAMKAVSAVSVPVLICQTEGVDDDDENNDSRNNWDDNVMETIKKQLSSHPITAITTTTNTIAPTVTCSSDLTTSAFDDSYYYSNSSVNWNNSNETTTSTNDKSCSTPVSDTPSNNNKNQYRQQHKATKVQRQQDSWEPNNGLENCNPNFVSTFAGNPIVQRHSPLHLQGTINHINQILEKKNNIVVDDNSSALLLLQNSLRSELNSVSEAEYDNSNNITDSRNIRSIDHNEYRKLNYHIEDARNVMAEAEDAAAPTGPANNKTDNSMPVVKLQYHHVDDFRFLSTKLSQQEEEAHENDVNDDKVNDHSKCHPRRGRKEEHDADRGNANKNDPGIPTFVSLQPPIINDTKNNLRRRCKSLVNLRAHDSADSISSSIPSRHGTSRHESDCAAKKSSAAMSSAELFLQRYNRIPRRKSWSTSTTNNDVVEPNTKELDHPTYHKLIHNSVESCSSNKPNFTENENNPVLIANNIGVSNSFYNRVDDNQSNGNSKHEEEVESVPSQVFLKHEKVLSNNCRGQICHETGQQQEVDHPNQKAVNAETRNEEKEQEDGEEYSYLDGISVASAQFELAAAAPKTRMVETETRAAEDICNSFDSDSNDYNNRNDRKSWIMKPQTASDRRSVMTNNSGMNNDNVGTDKSRNSLLFVKSDMKENQNVNATNSTVTLSPNQDENITFRESGTASSRTNNSFDNGSSNTFTNETFDSVGFPSTPSPGSNENAVSSSSYNNRKSNTSIDDNSGGGFALITTSSRMITREDLKTKRNALPPRSKSFQKITSDSNNSNSDEYGNHYTNKDDRRRTKGTSSVSQSSCSSIDLNRSFAVCDLDDQDDEQNNTYYLGEIDDVGDASITAETTCNLIATKAMTDPTGDDLLTQPSSVLRREIDDVASDECMIVKQEEAEPKQSTCRNHPDAVLVGSECSDDLSSDGRTNNKMLFGPTALNGDIGAIDTQPEMKISSPSDIASFSSSLIDSSDYEIMLTSPLSPLVLRNVVSIERDNNYDDVSIEDKKLNWLSPEIEEDCNCQSDDLRDDENEKKQLDFTCVESHDIVLDDRNNPIESKSPPDTLYSASAFDRSTDTSVDCWMKPDFEEFAVKIVGTTDKHHAWNAISPDTSRGIDTVEAKESTKTNIVDLDINNLSMNQREASINADFVEYDVKIVGTNEKIQAGTSILPDASPRVDNTMAVGTSDNNHAVNLISPDTSPLVLCKMAGKDLTESNVNLDIKFSSMNHRDASVISPETTTRINFVSAAPILKRTNSISLDHNISSLPIPASSFGQRAHGGLKPSPKDTIRRRQLVIENARREQATQSFDKQRFKMANGPTIASQANSIHESRRVGTKIEEADKFRDQNLDPRNGDILMPSYHQLIVGPPKSLTLSPNEVVAAASLDPSSLQRVVHVSSASQSAILQEDTAQFIWPSVHQDESDRGKIAKSRWQHFGDEAQEEFPRTKEKKLLRPPVCKMKSKKAASSCSVLSNRRDDLKPSDMDTLLLDNVRSSVEYDRKLANLRKVEAINLMEAADDDELLLVREGQPQSAARSASLLNCVRGWLS